MTMHRMMQKHTCCTKLKEFAAHDLSFATSNVCLKCWSAPLAHSNLRWFPLQLSTSQLRFSVPLVDMLPVVPSDHFFPDLDISCSEPLTYKILLLPAFLPKRLHRLNPNKLHGCQFRTSIHWARNKQTHL